VREKEIELLVMDVDGVLTDGKIVWIPMPDGSFAEPKAFDVMDGGGIVMARKSGIRTAVVSNRNSPAVSRRAEELSIDFVYLGVKDKRDALKDVLAKTGVLAERVCYVGDDLVDLGVMARVGFPVAVANAHPEVQARAAYVTRLSGGHGAVREVVELILKAQGKWDAILRDFTG
jgi:3-deoxy-D-manno-octulosonate 8-phosphate phosphatase (KDO 8-P phosphatase)